MSKDKIEERVDEKEVSFFNDKRNIVKNAPFSKIINAVKSGYFSNKIQEIRENILNGNADWEIQKSALPAFTPCGTFDKVRKIENLSEYSQIIVLDFDGVEINLESDNKFINKVNNDKYTHCSFISPSGRGFKAFAKVNTQIELHSIAYLQVAEYYESLTGLKVDKSGKDVTRLCFVSADERAYYNADSTVFNVVEQRKEVAGSFDSNAQIKTINPVICETQFQKIVDLTLRTKQFGEGSRNEFVNLLANNCNRWGVSMHEALSSILKSEYCYNKKEVVSTIYSAYKNAHQHNSFPLKKVSGNVAGVAEVAQQTTATISRFRPFGQLAEEGRSLEPLKKLFGNYILEKSTTLFPSERGVGKSLLAMQIAIKIAQGAQEFLGEELQVQGNVLYLNFELGEHTMKKRLEKLMANRSSDSEFQAYSFDQRGDFFGSVSLIREFCSEKQPVIIILDNLRTAIAGMDNENNRVMSSVVTEINKLKDEFKCAFLLVHHVKKGSGNQLTNSDMQSGAGALTDLVDADFFLRKSGVDKDQRILKRVKARECEEQEGAKLITLNPDSLWFEFVEEGVDERIHVLDEKSAAFKEKRDQRMLQLIKEGWSDAAIARDLNIDRSTVGRAKKRLATN